jgi:hypothetical protein
MIKRVIRGYYLVVEGDSLRGCSQLIENVLLREADFLGIISSEIEARMTSKERQKFGWKR